MLFDARLELIAQLGTARIEKLDAVVIVEVVRGTDHDTEVTFEALRHIGNAGSRQRPDQHHIDTRCNEARFERGFEHVPRETRVLADEHRAALRGQNPRRRTRQPQREVHGHRFATHLAAHTVSSKIFSAHWVSLPATAVTTLTASTAGATSWARMMRAPLRIAIVASATLACTRWSTGRPVIVPIIDLRDSPASTGTSRSRNRSKFASRLRLWGSALPKPNPGSTTRRLRPMPA